MGSKPGSRLIVAQRLGYPGTVLYVLLAQLSCVFTTDMYMPAFPEMALWFDVPNELVSMTLFVFFCFFPIGILLFGNVSDKLGRRPVMLAASLVFVATTLACMAAPNIYALIALRVLEALSAGATMAVGLALVKDCFVEEARETIMLYYVAAFAIGPVLAPLVGGQILAVLPWQFVFAALSVFGIVLFVMTLAFEETLPLAERSKESIVRNLGRFVVVLRNRSFALFLIVVVIYGYVPFVAYLGVSSYIYIEHFGMSAQEYSYFFAATVAVSMLNVVIYKPLSQRVRLAVLTSAILLASLAAGIGIWAVGNLSPLLFNALVIVYYLAAYLIKPYGVNTLLSLQEGDTGTASALVNFTGNFIGCFGILYMMLPFGDYFIRLGLITVFCTLVSLAAWLFILKGKTPLPGIKDQKRARRETPNE
jgi:DHA1 family bicyclomycin/chloramphenicol resistance-like MFS transporter